MLRRLSVENYALIDGLEIGFTPSLNIVTGETGAGKSILLGALGLLLGNRCDTGAIRDAGRNCIVEGEFDIASYGLEPLFGSEDLEYDDITVIRRVISPGGKSRAYVNDLPVPLTTLRALGARLIDIHSQHQSLMVESEAFRTSVLDSLAGHGGLLSEYAAVYGELAELRRRLEEAREEAARGRRDEEWLRYQVEELDGASLREGEQQALEAEQSELAHADEISEAVGLALRSLDEEELGIMPRLKAAETAMGHIVKLYPAAGEISSRLRSALLELKDLHNTLAEEAERIEADPERLRAVDDRLNTIYSLEQKHRCATLEELRALHADYRAKLEAIVHSDETVRELERRIDETRARAEEAAARITAGRKAAAEILRGEVEPLLGLLGMPEAKLVAEISPAPLGPGGADAVRYLFTANGAMAPQPLEKIASGGETSRVMLALKSVIARSAELPTIVFDEIDTGVSGRMADAMGNIICELSRSMQVINITHLPQVASKGEAHFLVSKADSTTAIRRLEADERVVEIAKMLSGNTVTEAAIAQARQLLGA